LFGGRGDGAHLIPGRLHHGHDFGQGRARTFGQLGGFFHGGSGLIHHGDGAGRALLDADDGAAHFLGGAHGFFGQFPDFVGHDGKAASGLAGPGRLDGGV